MVYCKHTLKIIRVHKVKKLCYFLKLFLLEEKTYKSKKIISMYSLN